MEKKFLIKIDESDIEKIRKKLEDCDCDMDNIKTPLDIVREGMLFLDFGARYGEIDLRDKVIVKEVNDYVITKVDIK